MNKLDDILVFIKLLDKSESVTKSKRSDNSITQMHAASQVSYSDWLVLTHKKATTCGTAMIITQLSAE